MSCVMRTHRDIVNEIGDEKLAELRGVSIHTARSWAHRDSIPAEHWQGIVERRHATLEELAAYAAANPRKRPAPDAQVAA